MFKEKPLDQTALIQELLQRIITLEKELARLQSELEAYKHPKNSQNSSIPPSKDENRIQRNKSLRKKSENPVGGQKGHEGNSLLMTDQPDIIERHTPSYCHQCGKDLSNIEEEFIERRQIIDIPVIKSVFTEHQIYQKRCSCGHITRSLFPSSAKHTIQYGTNTEALISYLHSGQYIPFTRIEEMMNDIFGLSISEGGIHCLLKRFTKKASPIYEEIKQRISSSSIVGTDETGCKVNGEKSWFWTWQNEQLTLIVHSFNRGIDTIKKVFAEGLPNSILNHDRWASHFHCKSKGHQICTSHLQRDLVYIEELYNNQWAIEMMELIRDALSLKKEMNTEDYQKPNEKRKRIEERLSNLLAQNIDPSHKKALAFQKNLNKHRETILPFLYYPKVPPDNNGSERSIRNAKVKLKVSGQFKSKKGAETYAINRSIIDTIKKSNQSVLVGLNFIANFNSD